MYSLRTALAALAILAVASPTLAQYPLHVGGSQADMANGVYYDDTGNSYLVGAFRGTADFDPSTGVVSLTSAGNTDGFIAVYDPVGALLFLAHIRGPGRETVNDVIFRNGIVYVTGYYEAGADFGNSIVPPNLGSRDAYVAAYSSASGILAPIWVAPISGPSDQIGEDLDVHPLFPSNVWATGSFRSTTNFGGITYTSAGNTDIFVAGYDPLTGVLFDAFQLGSTDRDAGLGLSLMRPDLPCITGYFRGLVDFDPSGGVFNIASAGNDDGFVACYLDPTPGSPTLLPPFNAFRIGGPGLDRGYDVDINLAAGGIVVNVTGGFFGTATFNGPSFTSNGSLDAFVASYDFTATPLWVVPFGGPQIDAGQSIDGDECGNVVATGAFRAGPVDFDPFVGGPSYFLPTYANYDAWVAGYDQSGSFRFANRVARNQQDAGYGVAVKPSGAHLAAGEFGQTPVFSSGTLVSAAIPITTYGNQDGWLAAYNVNGALQQASCTVAPSGLEVWTDFDAFSGGLFLDLTAPATSANDGTPVGGVLTPPGVVGRAAHFPAPNDHVVIPPDPSLAPGPNDLTVDAWVRLDSPLSSTYLTVVSNLDTPAAGNGYEVFLRQATPTDWAIVAVLNDGAGPPAVLTSPLFPLAPNTWRHVAVTVDHTTVANFYLDGDFLGAASAPPEGAITHQGPMFLHRSVLSLGNDQPGWLDEVEVFHALLTPTEIAQIYAAGKCKPCFTAPFQPTMRAASDESLGIDFAPSEHAAALPTEVALGTAYPNPFRTRAEITFALPDDGLVRVEVFDMMGRRVATLVDERRAAGSYTVPFEAGALPSGVYIVRLEAGGRTAVQRVTLLR